MAARRHGRKLATLQAMKAKRKRYYTYLTLSGEVRVREWTNSQAERILLRWGLIEMTR